MSPLSRSHTTYSDMRTSLLLCSLLLFAGCATTSANMRIGTDKTYVSLSDQRQALLSVREQPDLPLGATKLGKVDAARCHRRTDQTEPSEDDLRIDLKIAAYAIGAEGITQVSIQKTSGLAQNCWYILTGEATAFSVRK